MIICFVELQMRGTYVKIKMGNQCESHTKESPLIWSQTDAVFFWWIRI